MNVSFFVYKNNNGEILRVGSCPPAWLELQPLGPNETITPGEVSLTEHYVDGSQVVVRPRITTEDISIPIDGSSTPIHNIPPGTEVYINDTLLGEVDDGTFEFSCPVPGTYTIELKPPFPWIGASYRVTVDAP